MLKILRTLMAEQGQIKADAGQHQQDDRAAFGEVTATLVEIKEGQAALHGQIKAVAEAVAKITPTVDELKADKIKALERAAVIRELADEKARIDAADEKRAIVKDRDDERRSRWLGPILGAAATAIIALILGWANDHFHHPADTKAVTTITSTVDRPR